MARDPGRLDPGRVERGDGLTGGDLRCAHDQDVCGPSAFVALDRKDISPGWVLQDPQIAHRVTLGL